jgi:hypothetical protein
LNTRAEQMPTIMNQNQSTTFAPSPGVALDRKNSVASETSVEAASFHYAMPEQPRVSRWTLVGIAAILAAGYFIYKFAPIFERGRILPPF